MSATLARSGAAVGGSAGVTVAVIIVALLVFAIIALRRRGRSGK